MAVSDQQQYQPSKCLRLCPNNLVTSLYVGTARVAAAISMDFRYLYVSNNGSASLSVIDLPAADCPNGKSARQSGRGGSWGGWPRLSTAFRKYGNVLPAQVAQAGGLRIGRLSACPTHFCCEGIC